MEGGGGEGNEEGILGMELTAMLVQPFRTHFNVLGGEHLYQYTHIIISLSNNKIYIFQKSQQSICFSSNTIQFMIGKPSIHTAFYCLYLFLLLLNKLYFWMKYF